MPSSSPLSSPARPTRPHTCSLLAAADTMTRATLRAGRAAGAGRRAAARAERAVCIGREMGGWERKVGSVVPHRVQPLFFRSQVLLPFSPSVASPRPTSSPGVPRAEATGCRVTVVEGSHCVCEGEGDVVSVLSYGYERVFFFFVPLNAPLNSRPAAAGPARQGWPGWRAPRRAGGRAGSRGRARSWREERGAESCVREQVLLREGAAAFLAAGPTGRLYSARPNSCLSLYSPRCRQARTCNQGSSPSSHRWARDDRGSSRRRGGLLLLRRRAADVSFGVPSLLLLLVFGARGGVGGGGGHGGRHA